MPDQNPAIAAAVNAALDAVVVTADSNKNNIAPKSVDDARPELRANLTAKISADPVVQNATNSETHWWQKRSRWSAIVSAIIVIAAPVFTYAGIDINPETKEFIITILSTLGNLAAGYLALRAGIAVKPLFTGMVPTKGE